MTTDKIQSFPSRIVLELTPDCNLSCPMCPRQHIKLEESYMTWEMYKKLLDEIQEENSQAVVLPFWRGKSCMHPGEEGDQGQFMLTKKFKKFIELTPNPGQVLESLLQGARHAHKAPSFIFAQRKAATNQKGAGKPVQVFDGQVSLSWSLA